MSDNIDFMVRKATSAVTEAEVLCKSSRRCALCFYLKGDLSAKKGQIAHLDQNPANSVDSNLCFLCLEHHSEYDSKTRQHKNFTEKETKVARATLYKAIERREHFINTARGYQDVYRRWQSFSFANTILYHGKDACDRFISQNVVSCTVKAPCSMRDVINAIAEQSATPIPIDALAKELDQLVLPRGECLFGDSGDCIDRVVANYPGMRWWVTSKGLTISVSDV